MQKNINLWLSIVFLGILASNIGYAGCPSDTKISYCDSSAGFNVLTNGDYSSSYCTRHAVMDMQKFEGCCMWNGGVAKITEKGVVECRDGSSSELCALLIPHEKVAVY